MSDSWLRLGDFVLYRSQTYILKGFDPIGVPERRVYLEETTTGHELQVPLTEISPKGRQLPAREEG